MNFYNRFVYFVQGLDGGLVKIGSTGHPRERLRSLEREEGRPLRMLAYVPGDWDSEYWAHKFFAGERVRGEWFTESEKLLGLIDKCRELPSTDESGRAFLEWMMTGAIARVALRSVTPKRHVRSRGMSRTMSRPVTTRLA